MSTEDTQLALPNLDPVPLREPAAFHALRAVPLRLAVTITLQGLRLRDLQALKVGRVFPSAVSAEEDVPVWVGGALLGWAELDSADGRMAIRLTRLS